MGRITISCIVKLYISAVGGRHHVFYFSVLLGMFVLTHLLGVVQTWFLGYWASQYELPGKVPTMFYLTIYGVSFRWTFPIPSTFTDVSCHSVAILLVVIMSNAGTSALFISGS